MQLLKKKVVRSFFLENLALKPTISRILDRCVTKNFVSLHFVARVFRRFLAKKRVGFESAEML